MFESYFWKNRVEKEISALKRVSNAEKKYIYRKSRVEKSERRRKKMRKTKIPKIQPFTLPYYPGLRALSHKKLAKTHDIHPG